MQLDIEMDTVLKMQSGTEAKVTYDEALKSLSNYVDYNPDMYWGLARDKTNLIKQINALHAINPNQLDLTNALTSTYSFFNKKMTPEDYKKLAKTMPGSESPRLKKLGIALTTLAGLALVGGMILLMAFTITAVPAVGLGLLGWLGTGGMIGGMLPLLIALIINTESKASGVSAGMEQIANTAVTTGFISSTTKTL